MQGSLPAENKEHLEVAGTKEGTQDSRRFSNLRVDTMLKGGERTSVVFHDRQCT